MDEALCVGWIDGIRRSLDEQSYTIRFTPRRQGSIWSSVNIARARALQQEGRMTPAGLEAFGKRKAYRSGIYSYERREARLPEPYATILVKNRKARAFFESQPPYYRKAAAWYVVCAKREETRLRRLHHLIDVSARNRRLPGFDRPARKP